MVSRADPGKAWQAQRDMRVVTRASGAHSPEHLLQPHGPQIGRGHIRQHRGVQCRHGPQAGDGDGLQ